MTAVLSKRTIFNSRPRVLSALARKHRVPGAQLAIYHDGEIIAAEFGELEFRTGRRVTRDSAFPVGSISKCFTGTAAMTLGQLGDTVDYSATPAAWRAAGTSQAARQAARQAAPPVGRRLASAG